MFLLDPSKSFCSFPHPFLYHALGICPSGVTVISWCLHNKRISCQTWPRQNSWKPAPQVTCGTANCFSITILTKQIRCSIPSLLVFPCFFLGTAFVGGFCLFPAALLVLSLSPPAPVQNLAAKRGRGQTGLNPCDRIKNTDPCPVFYLLFYLIIKGRFYSHWGWCWRALREDSPSFQQIFFLPFSSVLICLTVNKMLPHCN